jgi:hypothetical protein
MARPIVGFSGGWASVPEPVIWDGPEERYASHLGLHWLRH